jgi:MFS family permease
MCQPGPAKDSFVDVAKTSMRNAVGNKEENKRRIWNLRERRILAAVACLQNALAGGLVFGWASIDRTMLISPTENGGAGLSAMETTMIFSWASSIAMLSSLVMGLVLDAFGPRTVSVLCNILVGAGCFLFAVAHSFEVLAAATCIIAFGGPGISSSIVHVANLFPRNQFLVLSCLCGSITFSFSILALFGDLWEQYNLGFRTLFGGYALVIMVSTCGSFLLWPDLPFQKEDSDELYSNNMPPTEEEVPLKECSVTAEQEYVEATLSHHQLAEEPLNSGLRRKLAFGRSQSYYQSVEAMENGPESVNLFVSLKDQPFWNQVLSKTYLRNLVIFVTNSFFVNFTIASISTEMADQQIFPLDTQHDLAHSFTLIMSGGLMASVLVGWLMDRLGLETCTIVTLALGQSSLILRMAAGQSDLVMVLGFTLYTLFRQFLFPVFIAGLTTRLGFKYYGILSGTGFALSGIAQFFMAAMVHALAGDCHLQTESIYGLVPCNHGAWNVFHILQIALLGVLTLIPILDRREAARQQHRNYFSIKRAAIETETATTRMQASTDLIEQGNESSSSCAGRICLASPLGIRGQTSVAADGSDVV